MVGADIIWGIRDMEITVIHSLLHTAPIILLQAVTHLTAVVTRNTETTIPHLRQFIPFHQLSGSRLVFGGCPWIHIFFSYRLVTPRVLPQKKRRLYPSTTRHAMLHPSTHCAAPLIRFSIGTELPVRLGLAIAQ